MLLILSQGSHYHTGTQNKKTHQNTALTHSPAVQLWDKLHLCNTASTLSSHLLEVVKWKFIFAYALPSF